MPISIQSALRQAAAQLGATATDTPTLDAEVLLAAVLERNRTFLVAHAEDPLNDAQANEFATLLARRADGEPVAYILGRREFWSLDLDVTPATLIPRPDSETLVHSALERLNGITSPRILDLGTGSGAIALALASEREDAVVVATDCAASALVVARRNGDRVAPRQVDWRHGSWFDAVDGLHPFDLVVSNPPYVASDDPHLDQGDVRFEPRSALCAGNEGMADLVHIINRSVMHLKTHGWLVVEHGYDQADAVREQFMVAGYQEVQLDCDLAGQPRVTSGRRL